MYTVPVLQFIFGNIAIGVAALGGLFTLANQFTKLTEHMSAKNAKKQELQAQFAAFLKSRERSTTSSAAIK